MVALLPCGRPPCRGDPDHREWSPSPAPEEDEEEGFARGHVALPLVAALQAGHGALCCGRAQQRSAKAGQGAGTQRLLRQAQDRLLPTGVTLVQRSAAIGPNLPVVPCEQIPFYLVLF